jgi:hypothetical protein
MYKCVISEQSYSKEIDMFTLLKTFPLVVPKNYDHFTRLSTFRKTYHRDFFLYNDALTDENFARVTVPLLPDQKLTVKLFGIDDLVGTAQCMSLLKEENALFVGAQGVSLVYELAKKELPYGRWAVSFDEKDALWKDAGGEYRMAGIGHISEGYGFDLGYYGYRLNSGRCVLCFSKG